MSLYPKSLQSVTKDKSRCENIFAAGTYLTQKRETALFLGVLGRFWGIFPGGIRQGLCRLGIKVQLASTIHPHRILRRNRSRTTRRGILYN
jgi:hypothetical protein